MSFGLLGSFSLIAALAVALPVIAHLLSKRRYQVVSWGAMQFLQLGNRTKRKFRIQDLLLLLIRICLIGIVVVAISRPWVSGGIFSRFTMAVQRDIVFIIDGSGSLSARHEKEKETVHQQAIQQVHQALRKLHTGDRVALIDARATPRRLIHTPTTDFKLVRDQLSGIPEPAGASNLPLAIEDALKVLATSANTLQKIVVVSDHQSLGWKLEDEFVWERIADLRRQFDASPQLEFIPLGSDVPNPHNFSVGRLEFSRDMTVPEFPIKIQARIRQDNGTVPVKKQVFLEIDRQRVTDQNQEITLPPNGEVTVEFNHIFSAPGEYQVSAVIPPDELEFDNHADGVVAITPGLPVLLVDGDSRLDPTRSESFYLRSAFAASGTKSPWINATIIQPDQLNDLQLSGIRAVVLLNVKSLSTRQWQALKAFVRDGGGLIVAPGDQIDAAKWNQLDAKREEGLLPAQFTKIEQAPTGETASIESDSLQAPWLTRFRQESNVDFVQSRFAKWWGVDVQPTEAQESKEKETPERPSVSPTQTLVRTTQGIPLLLSREFGQGTVLQLTFPLDADWSTLPAKGDFIPFVYEMTFRLAGQQARRNVDVDMPLMLPLPQHVQTNYVVEGPGIRNAPATPVQRGRVPYAVFRETAIPGIYRFTRDGSQQVGTVHPFVVDDDHAESNLAILTEADWGRLANDFQIKKIDSTENVVASDSASLPKAELWWVLMLAVLGLLIFEAILTRRMVQGGHLSAASD
ncbi:VWA domain-containing protein [Planctomicrobium sp. SH527]|uniref:VWA domain-containing protein n=1 Tax=Planctomicrobium sp. SH527 TaxID=3448123 RepID=UPI003F5B83BF